MVNPIILDYLRRHSGQYKLEDLKNKLISKGYPLEEIDFASQELGLEEVDKKMGFKWMKLSGIIGIIFLILGILMSVFSIILPFFNILEFNKTPIEDSLSFLSNPLFLIAVLIVFLLIVVGLIIFYKGFARMGKICESKLLVFSSSAFILLISLFAVLSLAFIIFLIFFGKEFIDSLLNSNSTGGLMVVGSAINISGIDFGVSGYGLIFGALFLILFSFLNALLFFIGLINAKKKVKFAKISGIFGMIIFLSSILSSIGLILNPALSIAITSSGFGAFFITSIFLSLGCLDLLFMTLALLNASRKFEG